MAIRFFLYQIILLGLAVASLSLAATTCTREGSKNTVWMKQVNDHVGYCGFFAYRALIHQFRCREDRLNCQQPSVLDMINQADELKKQYKKEFGFEDLDFPSFLLKHMTEIKDETCLPFQSFFKLQRQNSQTKDSSWSDAFGIAWERALAYDKHSRCFNGNKLCYSPFYTKAEYNKMVQSYLQSLLPAFIKRQKCSDRLVPKNKVVQAQATTEKLKHILMSGNSALVGLIIPEFNGKRIDPHAVVVTNYKTVCCLNICTTSYQLLDSLGFYWSKTHYNGWVSETELFENINKQNPTLTYLQSMQDTADLPNLLDDDIGSR